MPIRTPDTPVVARSATVVPHSLPNNQARIISRADWGIAPRVSRSWNTEIAADAVYASEQRVARWARPRIEVSAAHTAADYREMGWLITMMQMGSPAYTIPTLDSFRAGVDQAWSYAIMADEAIVLATDGVTSPIGIYLEFDTTCFRFFTGQRAWLLDKSATGFDVTGVPGAIPAYQVTILDVLPDKVEVDTLTYGPVISFIETRDLVLIPAIDCMPSVEMELETPVCAAGRLLVSAIEYLGQNQAPPIHSGSLAPEYDYFDGLPVWMPDHNWEQGMSMTITRGGEEATVGRGAVSVLSGRAAVLIVDVAILTRRAQWWPILRLFDSMRGMAGAFWLITSRGLWENVTVASSTTLLQLPVRTQMLGGDFGPIQAITMLQTDGTYQLVEVVSVVFNSANQTTDVTTVQTVLAGTYSKILLSMRARFASDTLEEEWPTCDLVRSQIQLQQIREDQSLEV